MLSVPGSKIMSNRIIAQGWAREARGGLGAW